MLLNQHWQRMIFLKKDMPSSPSKEVWKVE
jgi:hypothetical protein